MEGLDETPVVVGRFYAYLPEELQKRMREALRQSLRSFDHASDTAADCILENIWNEAVGNK